MITAVCDNLRLIYATFEVSDHAYAFTLTSLDVYKGIYSVYSGPSSFLILTPL